MMPTRERVKVHAQTGVVLVISLIMLMLLTLIGVTAMQNTGLEEKMAGNMKDQNLAFQAAESALSAAEDRLLAVVLPPFNDAGTGGFYSSSVVLNDSALIQDSFWATNLVATSSVTNLGNNLNPPKYIIQQLKPTCFVKNCFDKSAYTVPYRVTVRATGGSSSTVVILQSIFTP